MNNCYFIVRHGESVFNEKKCHQGWISGNPLTNKGISQAKEAASKLKDLGIEKMYASPLLRARQTAKIIAGQLNLPISFSSKLKDYRRSQGQEGLHVSQYSILPDFLQWKETAKADRSFHLPDGESYDAFEKRIVSFAKSLDKKFNQKNILIVAHEGVVWYLVQYWTGKEMEGEKVGNAELLKVLPATKQVQLI